MWMLGVRWLVHKLTAHDAAGASAGAGAGAGVGTGVSVHGREIDNDLAQFGTAGGDGLVGGAARGGNELTGGAGGDSGAAGGGTGGTPSANEEWQGLVNR